MAKEKIDAEVSATDAQQDAKDNNEVKVRKPRRGLGSARGTQRLKFNHTDAAPMNGLFIGHLDSVNLTFITIGEDKVGMPSFNGLEIPKIVLTFASNEADLIRRKYVNLQFMPAESNAETIPGGKQSWKVDSVMNWFKHILNVFYLKGRELTEEEELALSLPFEDFDEEGNYVPVEPEEVINGWKTLFENFENILNRGREGNPIYRTKDNKEIPIWMKLIRFNKVRGEWKSVAQGNSAGDLVFPTYVGEGAIELHKANVIPSIHLNVITESIIPREINKPKAPNMGVPGMAGTSIPMNNGVPTGIGTESMYGAADNINMAAAEDLPF